MTSTGSMGTVMGGPIGLIAPLKAQVPLFKGKPRKKKKTVAEKLIERLIES